MALKIKEVRTRRTTATGGNRKGQMERLKGNLSRGGSSGKNRKKRWKKE